MMGVGGLVRIMLPALLFGAACVPLAPRDRGAPAVVADTGSPDTGDDGDDDDGPVSGQWAEPPLELSWWVAESWGGGGCVDSELRATTMDLSSWRLDIRADQSLDEWLFGGGGANVDHLGGDDIAVSSFSDGLSMGQSVQFSWCSEPTARPVGVVSTWEGPWIDPETSGTLTDASGLGELSYELDADDWGQPGCLDLVLVNLTEDTWSDWTMQIEFEWEVMPTDASGWELVDDEAARIVVGPGVDLELEPGGDHRGSVCFEYAAPPEELEIYR